MSTNIQENFSKIDLNQNNNEKENIPPLSTKYTHFNKTHQSDEVHTSCIDANKNTRTNFYRYEIYIKEDFKNFSKTKNGPISDQLENCHLGVNFINDNNSAIYAISKSASHSTRTLKINDPSDASDDLRYIRLSNNNDPIEENLDENENENSVPSSVHYILPNKNFIGLWESLIYNDDNLKPKLYNFMKTINSFSLKNVDSNLVSLNKLILLHGLPGSGKTSLCKALAQKLTVELVSQEANQTYKYGQLIEINCHSLFSKWFSESGKLVMKQFQNIRDMALDQSCIIFVLIDEIESIAGKRSAVDTGTEPSDSIRVVNAVLTQLDSLKDYKNVLCLSTSNLIEKIDEALLDRADLSIKIPLPNWIVIQNLLSTSINELIIKGVVKMNLSSSDQNVLENVCKLAEKYEISGRNIKKLSFLACIGAELPVSYDDFMRHLIEVVENYRKVV